MNTCVVGLQWGDEGKGKVVDILAERSEVVVRYGGGANAGHTVVIADNRFALHLLPSGAIREGILCVIANAVVVDPSVLIDEIDGLAQRGISLAGRLFISENAHVVLDYHKREDQLREESLGKAKIGTTIRGIGPCYADKVGRSYAVRMSDLRDLKALSEKLRMILAYKNKLFGALYGAEPMDVEVVIENCRRYADRLVPYTTDTTELLHAVIGEGKSVLFEGAQGSLLDLDHGTFPYVTSSNSSSLGLPSGCGVPARMVDKYIGVAKAYTTRVGAGPFPTEQDNAIGEYIRVKGHEYGTTTGRPRRCGWFDGVAAAYSIRIGSVDSVALMHLDTLTGIQELQVCRAYSIDGKETTFFPSNIDRLARAKPVYETLSGWDEDLGNATSFASLPVAAQRYV
ncbi:MAG: adenylosuccinate synthase, partial [Phycisphaerae bacterium]|nr:adenylosuccinate synthase [Phycisphaerae bacterium]